MKTRFKAKQIKTSQDELLRKKQIKGQTRIHLKHYGELGWGSEVSAW